MTHALGHLRQEFCDAVEAHWRARLPRHAPMPSEDLKAVTRLWNSSDILPREVDEMVGDLLEGLGRRPAARQTYAAAARALAQAYRISAV